MRFLIDAQLPPALAQRLAKRGHLAEHVTEIGLGGASDQTIWDYATRSGAVLVTKDGDFAEMTLHDPYGPAVLWVRLGNTTNRALWAALRPLLPELLDGLELGERLIEIA